MSHAYRRTASAVRLLLAALTAGVLAAAAIGFAGAQQTFTPRDEEPDEFPAGPGRDETFYACSPCHAFKLVAQQGMSRERWDETIAFMVERHKMPPPDPKEREQMLDYLASAFPQTGGPRGWRNPFAKN